MYGCECTYVFRYHCDSFMRNACVHIYIGIYTVTLSVSLSLPHTHIHTHTHTHTHTHAFWFDVDSLTLPYTLTKEPYILSKEPSILPKEPYMLPKVPSYMNEACLIYEWAIFEILFKWMSHGTNTHLFTPSTALVWHWLSAVEIIVYVYTIIYICVCTGVYVCVCIYIRIYMCM